MSLMLPLLLSSALAALQSQTPESFTPVPGMELLPALQRAQDVGPAPADQHLSLAVSMPFAKPAEAQAFVDAVSDPRSPQYRQFLSPEQIGERFGLPQSRVDELADYLRQSGMQVTLVAKTRLSILADCTVAQAERAFHTTLRSYEVAPQDPWEPAEFFAYSSAVQLPARLAPIVIDVSGLENHTRPRPLTTLLNPFLTRGLYGLATMFNGSITGTGRTVGISNWDGFRASQYLLYLSHFALPIPAGGAGTNIVTVPCNGGGLGAGPEGAEGDLDIQMALGTAPLANFRIYDGSSAFNLVGMLTVETNENLCDVITESYGWQATTSIYTASHNQHVAMSAEGITYMAASGDNGTTMDPPSGYPYPGMDPEVLDVGGTTANVDPSTGHRLSEIGWSGSGGGWSTTAVGFNVRPSWQVGNGVPPVNGSNNHRLIPDVGFHASGNGTGAYQFYFGGGLQSNQVGTSFASPMFAGALATTEQKIISLGGLTPDGLGHRRFGRIQNLIYAQNGDPTIWFDIIVGSNGTLPAGQGASTAHAGWDTVCGWGPMNCEAFAPVAACSTGANCNGVGTPFCFGDGIDPQVTTLCPCFNFGSAGHGCANAVNFQGAQLSAAGTTVPDTVQLTSAGEPNTSLSIFLQGNNTNVSGALFGDGVRCAAGLLKRLYVHNAVGGSVTAPVGADAPITTRSAQLGDSILPGTPRYYQTYYRDSNLAFCSGLGFNVSGGLRIDW